MLTSSIRPTRMRCTRCTSKRDGAAKLAVLFLHPRGEIRGKQLRHNVRVTQSAHALSGNTRIWIKHADNHTRNFPRDQMLCAGNFRVIARRAGRSYSGQMIGVPSAADSQGRRPVMAAAFPTPCIDLPNGLGCAAAPGCTRHDRKRRQRPLADHSVRRAPGAR